MGDKKMIELVEFEGEFDDKRKMEIFLDIYVSESLNKSPFQGIIYIFDVNNQNSL